MTLDKARVRKKLHELDKMQLLKIQERVQLYDKLEAILKKSTWKVSDCKKAIEILFSLLLNRKR